MASTPLPHRRLVEGLGITAGEDYFQTSARRLAGQGYAALRDLL